MREKLNAAFLSLNSIYGLASDFGTGYGHEAERLPGRVEWMLYRIGHGVYDNRGAYTRNDIEKLAEITALAQMRANGPNQQPAGREAAVRKKVAEFSTALK